MAFTTTAIPIWLVALVFAATAPWCVRAFADVIEQRLRRRTAAVLARAGVSRDNAGAEAEGGEDGEDAKHAKDRKDTKEVTEAPEERTTRER